MQQATWWERRREYVSGALWVVPAFSMVGAVLLGSALSLVRVPDGSPLSRLLFAGTAEEARRMLLSIATTLVGVIALTVGLSLVALQVAANRYSPRLLRSFLRDRPAQITLGVFIAAFTYNAAGLYTVGVYGQSPSEDYPRLAVTVGLAMVFLCLGALIFYIDYVVHSIQIDAVLARVRKIGTEAIKRRPPGIGRSSGLSTVVPPAWAQEVAGRRSGYVQTINPARIVAIATDLDVTIKLIPAIGDRIAAGTEFAWVWRSSPELPSVLPQLRERRIGDAVTIDFERTTRHDVSVCVQQIVDIALLSIHIKDFYTAAQACNELTELLAGLANLNLGDEVFADASGQPRLVIPAPGFGDFLELAVGELKRFGADEPTVMKAVLRMLRDVGAVAEGAARKEAVAHQIRHVYTLAERVARDPADLVPLRAEADEGLRVTGTRKLLA